MSRNRNSNTLVVPQAASAIEQMKYQIAYDLGVNLSPGYNGHLTTREAGSIGGMITRTLIQQAEQQISGQRF